MGCCPCFSSQKSIKERSFSTFKSHLFKSRSAAGHGSTGGDPAGRPKMNDEQAVDIKSQNFTFRELAAATKNFRQECLLGQGSFGRVYRATLQGSKEVVAVKQIDKNGLQHGSKEFLAEVAALSLVDHENLVKLVGYCADGDQRLLVYEFLPGGSLDDHLFDVGPDKEAFDWCARMKLALGAANGLEYLHDKANPPIIYGNMKSSNILLDGDLNPKLSDFGMANIGPNNDKFHGYSAPEYTVTNNMTLKSDVYSFGVVLLELITGRRAIATARPLNEQNLVAWAQPKFRDPKLYPELADPLLNNKFNEKSLNQAVAVAAMCLQDEASVRPLIADIVTTLSFLLAAPPDPAPTAASSCSSSSSDDDDDSSSDNINNGKEEDDTASSTTAGSSNSDDDDDQSCSSDRRSSKCKSSYSSSRHSSSKGRRVFSHKSKSPGPRRRSSSTKGTNTTAASVSSSSTIKGESSSPSLDGRIIISNSSLARNYNKSKSNNNSYGSSKDYFNVG